MIILRSLFFLATRK